MKNEPDLNIHAFIISITIFIVVDNVISSNSVTVSTYNITKHTVSRQIYGNEQESKVLGSTCCQYSFSAPRTILPKDIPAFGNLMMVVSNTSVQNLPYRCSTVLRSAHCKDHNICFIFVCVYKECICSKKSC